MMIATDDDKNVATKACITSKLLSTCWNSPSQKWRERERVKDRGYAIKSNKRSRRSCGENDQEMKRNSFLVGTT